MPFAATRKVRVAPAKGGGVKSASKKASRDPEASQKRILDAALSEFAANGFASSTMDDIARRARINKRMLYHYFKDKEGLFREVLRRKIAERSAWHNTAPANYFDLLPSWFELMWSDPDWVRLLEWEALQVSDGKALDEERRAEGFARAVARVEEQQKKGFIPTELNPAQFLISMLGLMVYPLAFPHLARLASGHKVSSAAFKEERIEFLKQFSAFLKKAMQPPLKSK